MATKTTATNATAPKAQQPAPAPVPAAPAAPEVSEAPASGTKLTGERVLTILRSRRIIDASMVGMEITEGLRIIGRGFPTKDGARVVYNTNAMRKGQMAEAVQHYRNGLVQEELGNELEAQEAYRQALNTGEITFSIPSEWAQFAPNSTIIARVESFDRKDGGGTGINIGSVRPAPSVSLKSAAATWDALLAGEDEEAGVLDAANVQ